MRSSIARQLPRRLLRPSSARQLHVANGRPLIAHHLRRRTTLRCLNGCQIRPSGRRTFFGIFQKPPREVKEPEFEPGYDTLLEFSNNRSHGLRVPPRTELVHGFRALFDYKMRNGVVVNTTQAICALNVLNYLCDPDNNEERAFEGRRAGLLRQEQDLSLEDLRVARAAVLKAPKRGYVGAHLKLSKALYEEIKRRAVAAAGTGKGEGLLAGEADVEDFRRYLGALSQYGAAVDAAAALESYWEGLQAHNAIYKGALSLWPIVLKGLSREGNEEALIKTLQHSEEVGVEFMPPYHEAMVTFFARKGDFAQTKIWFEKPIYADWPPTAETYRSLLNLVESDHVDWVNKVFMDLCNTNPAKACWDVIFQWAVLVQDKGEEEVKDMMKTMIKLNASKPTVRPDVDTINGLIQVAMDKKEPLLAERFFNLAAELGIAANVTTYALQLENRIAADDISGAAASYRQLENLDILDEHALSAVNQYARALCAQKKPDTQTLLSVISDLEQRQAYLEPESIADICLVFLRADQLLEVIDTLSLHAQQHSIEERQVILKAFVDYCLDRGNSTARAWDAYSLLRQFFPDLQRPDRVRLMESFFERKRPDMATHIFGHMRAHDNPDMRPTVETYAQCFEGLGRYPDAESLRVVHNMFKMDMTVNPTTQIYNGLMMAYLGAEDPHRAWEFWIEITRTPAGPNYNSLNIAFRICEKWGFGDQRAHELWAQLEKMDVDVPPFVFASYLAALAAHGHLEEVKKLIRAQNAQLGHAPGWLSLGIVYNALPNEVMMADFEAWATAEYTQLWEELKKKRRKRNINGLERFELSRDMWVR